MTTATKPLFALGGVTCRYDSENVVEDVDLEVCAGEFVGVVGPSGSGKTTLLRAIAGSMAAAEGSVTRRRGLRIAYVPQVETIDWSFPVTVAQCVLMARVSGRLLPWPSAAERAAVARDPRAAGHRAPARPPHPRAVGRPAAARLHRAGDARRAGAAAARRADVRRRRAPAPRDPAPARRPQRARAGDRADDPRPQRHRGAPATRRVPEPHGHRRRPPGRRAHARHPRTHLRREHAGARARRHAGRRGRLRASPRAARHAHARSPRPRAPRARRPPARRPHARSHERSAA